jgi:hypothetical protein
VGEGKIKLNYKNEGRVSKNSEEFSAKLHIILDIDMRKIGLNVGGNRSFSTQIIKENLGE